jgi:phosphoribosylaminoimidazole-succinocarboxamide synthase
MTFAGWRHTYSGKVRDLYIPEAEASLVDSPIMLIVTSDRISAFDQILEPDIPGKGALLTKLSRWWFWKLAEFPNHLMTGIAPAEVSDRAMLVRTLVMIPVECVVRGYLAGSGWL